MANYKCKWCGKKGVYWYNKDQVVRSVTKSGMGAHKLFKCKYCGRHAQSLTQWVKQPKQLH